MDKNIIVEIEIDSTGKSDGVPGKLIQLRKELDDVDTNIIHLIAKRFSIIEEIHEEKKKHNMPVLQTARREEVLNRKIQLAKDLGVSPELVLEVWTILHTYSIAKQQEMNT